MFDTPRLLLYASSSMLMLIILAAYSYETAWSPPQPHPKFQAMEVGGPRAADDARHWRLGVIFGGVTLLTITSCLSFAAKNSAHLRFAIVFGSAIYVAAFVALMFAYREYTSAGPSLQGPFPPPVTWMVFGVWSAPIVFTVIYCVKFNSWFAPGRDGEAN